jgi:hypothetical protein
MAMQFDNIQMIKEAVALGSGISILPARTMQAEIAQGRLVSIPLHAPELVRPVGIVHRKRKRFSHTVQSFLELLLEQPAPVELHGLQGTPRQPRHTTGRLCFQFGQKILGPLTRRPYGIRSRTRLLTRLISLEKQFCGKRSFGEARYLRQYLLIGRSGLGGLRRP